MTIPAVAWALTAAVTLLLGIVTVADLRSRTIPNTVLAPAAPVLAGLAYLALPHALFAWDLLAAALLLAAYTRFDLGMGAGDIKLLALLCVAVSWPMAALLLLGAQTGMLAPALARALRVRRSPEPPLALPMAPFLAGAWVTVFLGAIALTHSARL